jgi:hypothetical protein
VKNNDFAWIGLVVAGVVIFNLLQKTQASSSQTLSAGQGADPFEESAYTVEDLAGLGGLL